MPVLLSVNIPSLGGVFLFYLVPNNLSSLLAIAVQLCLAAMSILSRD